MKYKIFNVLLLSSSLLGLTSTQAVSEEIQVSPAQISFFDFFGSANRTQNTAVTPAAQTNSPIDPFDAFFANVNRVQNTAVTPVAQTSPFADPFDAFFGNVNRAPNTTSSPVAQTNFSADQFAAFFGGISQPISQAAMSARASDAVNTALKTPNLTAFNFNSAQNTSTENGVVVKDESAYQVKATDIFGNTTVTQEGSPNLLNGFNQNPVAATPDVITPSADSFVNFFGNAQVAQKPATITPAVITPSADSFANFFDNYNNMVDEAIIRVKVKTALTTLFQKSEQEIETLLTDNDQYRALSTIWPTLNNNQKVENTIDYLFTAPQIKNVTQVDFTSAELEAVKEESVAFVQKSNVTLPNNLEDFVDNLEVNIRNIFARNGENLDDIL